MNNEEKIKIEYLVETDLSPEALSRVLQEHLPSEEFTVGPPMTIDQFKAWIEDMRSQREQS